MLDLKERKKMIKINLFIFLSMFIFHAFSSNAQKEFWGTTIFCGNNIIAVNSSENPNQLIVYIENQLGVHIDSLFIVKKMIVIHQEVQDIKLCMMKS
jgi:hypothetical protein